MLRTPGTAVHGTWTFLRISEPGPMPVLMPTCTNAGENFFPNPAPCAAIQWPRSITTTTASRCRSRGFAVNVIWTYTWATKLSTWNNHDS